MTAKQPAPPPVATNKIYTVVLRCVEGMFRIPIGRGMEMNLSSQFGPYTLKVVTRTDTVKHIATPLPRELWLEVVGPAPSMELALNIASSTANNYVRQLAFAANSWQGLLRVHLAYDTTPKQHEREFFQNWVPDEAGLPRAARYVDPDLMNPVWTAIVSLPAKERPRILRAITQYTDALQHWRPGNELYALSHLYMGVEAITPLVIAREVQRRGLKNRQELEQALRGPPADSWKLRLGTYFYRFFGGHITSRLDSWARLELIFRNDRDAFKTAKRASDYLEHGLAQHHEVHALAVQCVGQTAQYLRDAMLYLLPLTDAERAALRSKPYAKPFSTAGFERQILATIICDQDDVAPPDQAYPRVRWEFNLIDFATEPDGSPKMNISQRLTPLIREGATFSLKRAWFAGPGDTKHSAIDVTVTRANEAAVASPAPPPTAAGVTYDIDQPSSAQWLRPIGRLIVNVNAIRRLATFWLQKLTSAPADELGALSFRQSVERILALVAAPGISEETRMKCQATWSEALQLDQTRVAVASARAVPEGLEVVEPRSDGKLLVIDDVKKLADINDRAVAVARIAGELLDALHAAGSTSRN